MTVKEALRLLPDLIRLIKRLAADPDTPRGVRIRLALLLVYLALPIDLIPDFIPVLGYADDAIIVALVLRSATRSAGTDALAKHWPGTPEGLIALKRLCRLNDIVNDCDPANTASTVACFRRAPARWLSRRTCAVSGGASRNLLACRV